MIKTSIIRYQQDNVNVFNEEDWPEMNEFLIKNIIRLVKTFKEQILTVKKKLNI